MLNGIWGRSSSEEDWRRGEVVVRGRVAKRVVGVIDALERVKTRRRASVGAMLLMMRVESVFVSGSGSGGGTVSELKMVREMEVRGGGEMQSFRVTADIAYRGHFLNHTVK